MRRFSLLLIVAILSASQSTFGQTTFSESSDPSRVLSEVSDSLDHIAYLDTLSASKVKVYPRKVPALFESAAEETYADNSYDYYLTTENIAEGRNFLERHQDLLDRAENRFGPSPEVLTAMLHFESDFGSNPGNYQVLGALISTLYYLDTSGWSYDVAAEIAALPSVTESMEVSIYNLHGSFAGAFGIPQFMPSNFSYAVDGNNNGRINLFNLADAVMSMSHYLSEHGWHKSRKKALTNYYGRQIYADYALKYAKQLK
jgi:membrane-bound lytic murein transglycosylase B